MAADPNDDRVTGLPPRSAWTDLLAVLCIYAAAHGLMLLNRGVYWDDWLIVGNTSAEIARLYSESGLPMFGSYHDALNALGVPGYRVLVFLSYLASAVSLWAILRRIPHIDRRTAFFLLLIFVLFPSNSARISIMASRTAVCSALFFIGLWALMVYLDGGRLRWRVASLVLLSASFTTHSLLAFYAVALACIGYRVWYASGSLRPLVPWFARHPDFLLLPALFWAFKLAYLTPYASFRGYNRVTPESALLAFNYIDNALRESFVEPIVDAFALPLPIVLAAALAALAAYRFGPKESPPPQHGRDGWFLVFGLLAFVAGVFPYLAVGKIPAAAEWDSRHQLLTPLGASFMLVYLARLLLALRQQNAVLALVATLFVADNARVWADFQRDWYKQVAVMENLKAMPEVQQGKRFVFEDRARDLDANHRRYRDYEYTGLLQMAFGERTREGRGPRAGPPRATEIALLVEPGPLELTLAEVARLRVLEATDEARFRASVRAAVRVTALPPRAAWRAVARPNGVSWPTDGASGADSLRFVLHERG